MSVIEKSLEHLLQLNFQEAHQCLIVNSRLGHTDKFDVKKNEKLTLNLTPGGKG